MSVDEHLRPSGADSGVQPQSHGDRQTCDSKLHLRIGTLNVQGLAYKLSSVISLATSFAVDILCLQETNLAHCTISSAQAVAKSAGWNLICSKPAYDVGGTGTAGVAILSRWPCEILEQDGC